MSLVKNNLLVITATFLTFFIVFTQKTIAASEVNLSVTNSTIKPGEEFLLRYTEDTPQSSASAKYFVRPYVSKGKVYQYDITNNKWLSNDLPINQYPKSFGEVILKITDVDKARVYLSLVLIDTVSGISNYSYSLPLWVGDFYSDYLSSITSGIKDLSLVGGINKLQHEQGFASKTSGVESSSLDSSTATTKGTLLFSKNIPTLDIVLMSLISLCIASIMYIAFSMLKYNNDAKKHVSEMASIANSNADNFPRIIDSG